MSAKYWDTDTYYGQPDISELKRNATNTARKASAKGKTLEPIVIEGRNIAKTWWGKAWCENLERYADFESRLSRGKRYVRAGAVVDLKVEKGKVLAKVQGTRKTPYKVEIRISPLSEEHCEHILERCSRKIDSLETLVGGTFPDELKELFTESEAGLFPSPSEISLLCSCPDWALMCKHVAAVLYGIGAKLDADPLLFFTLRGIEADRFLDVAIENRIESMLANADQPSERILFANDLTDLFGVL